MVFEFDRKIDIWCGKPQSAVYSWWVLMAALIFDCDPTLFYPDRDVDDSLALGYALRKFKGEVELVGVTTVFGNNSADLTYRDARRIVEVAGEDVPVMRGAASRGELGRPSDAAEFIVEKSREYGEVEFLATGPLTNVATAYMLDEELVDRVGRVVIMGGAVFRRGNVPASDAEFNFWSDPAAASMVVESFRNVVLAPLDITMRVRWRVETLEPLGRSRDPLARFLYEAAMPWAVSQSRLGGFHPHDVVAAVYLVRSDLYSTRRVEIAVSTREPGRGKVIVGLGGREVLMLESLDQEGFLNEYLSAFG